MYSEEVRDELSPVLCPVRVNFLVGEKKTCTYTACAKSKQGIESSRDGKKEKVPSAWNDQGKHRNVG